MLVSSTELWKSDVEGPKRTDKAILVSMVEGGRDSSSSPVKLQCTSNWWDPQGLEIFPPKTRSFPCGGGAPSPRTQLHRRRPAKGGRNPSHVTLTKPHRPFSASALRPRDPPTHQRSPEQPAGRSRPRGRDRNTEGRDPVAPQEVRGRRRQARRRKDQGDHADLSGVPSLSSPRQADAPQAPSSWWPGRPCRPEPSLHSTP